MQVKDNAWTFRRRLVACEVGSALFCGGTIGLALDRYNRLYLFYSWWDTAALILLVAGSGVAAAVLLHAAAQTSRGRSGRWLSPWFYFLIVLVAFNSRPALRLKLVEYVPWLNGTAYYLLIWAMGAVLTLAGYLQPRMRRAAAAGWRYSVFLWPLLPILLFNLGAASRWEDGGDRPSGMGRRTDGSGAPVLVLILDMIGHEDVFEEQRVKSHLPGLAAFAETATVFHRARSPGDFTETALPGLLLQEEVGPPLLGRGAVQWMLADNPGMKARTAEEFPMSLPVAFKRAGYRRAFIGEYLPYSKLMPGAFDGVFTRSYYGAAIAGHDGTALGNALLRQALGLVSESKDPVSALIKGLQLYSRPFKQYYREMVGEVQAEGLRYIRDCMSPGDFAVIHLPIPHPPYVFDSGGGRCLFDYMDPAGYPGQLEYADRIWGEWTDAIHQTGLWEESWVVMLADHGPHFRDYGQAADGKRHVPLMVKAPGQVVRKDVESPIRLVDFEDIPGFPLMPAEED